MASLRSASSLTPNLHVSCRHIHSVFRIFHRILTTPARHHLSAAAILLNLISTISNELISVQVLLILTWNLATERERNDMDWREDWERVAWFFKEKMWRECKERRRKVMAEEWYVAMVGDDSHQFNATCALASEKMYREAIILY